MQESLSRGAPAPISTTAWLLNAYVHHVGSAVGGGEVL
jgi:hypothetical protein